MNWQNPYIAPLLFSGLISFILIYFTMRYRNSSGVIPFIILLLCSSIWSIGYALEIMSEKFDQKFFWLNAQQLGIFGSPVAWFLFIVTYIGKSNWLNWKRIVGISIPSLTAILLIWTDHYHNLMRLDVYIVATEQLSVLRVERTSLSLLLILYVYSLLFISLILCINSYRKALHSYKKQYVAIIASLLLPIIVNILDMVGLNPIAPFGPTSLIFVISGLLMAWSLYKYHLLKVSPISMDRIIEKMNQGIIVTDTSQHILDINETAISMISSQIDDTSTSQISTPQTYIGQHVSELIGSWPQWLGSYAFQSDKYIEISINRKDDTHYYEIKLSSIHSEDNILLGHVATIHDITNRKRVEKELTHKANTDSLTDIYNRGHLINISNKFFQKAVKDEDSFALLLLDIDYFKQINDTYGHHIGDQVLIQFAHLCKNFTRECDVLGRLGGEEFVITLPYTSREEALRIAGRIRQKIEDHVFEIDDHTNIKITVSIGIAMRESSDQLFQSMIERADKKMYIAKEGRNRVIV